MNFAKQNGKSYWNIDVDGDPEKMEAKTDMILGHVIETMQRSVCFLVNQRDTKRLTALQACYNEVLKQAEECLSTGSSMSIKEVDQGWN